MEAMSKEKKLANLVYLLQAVGLFVGIIYFVAVFVNYLKMGDVRGTWVESHFQWQIKTFWFSVLLAVIGALTIPFIIGNIVLAIDVFWVVYRIIFGWNKLSIGDQVATMS